MQTSKGSYRFQRERYLLRGQSVLEQAWLLLQAMKADKSRENPKKQGRHAPEITGQDIAILNSQLSMGRFEEVKKVMQKFDTKRLDCDSDSTLTVKALHTYQELIKHRLCSLEGVLLTRHINKNLWADMHAVKDRLFQLPVGFAMDSEVDPEVERINKGRVRNEQSLASSIQERTLVTGSVEAKHKETKKKIGKLQKAVSQLENQATRTTINRLEVKNNYKKLIAGTTSSQATHNDRGAHPESTQGRSITSFSIKSQPNQLPEQPLYNININARANQHQAEYLSGESPDMSAHPHKSKLRTSQQSVNQQMTNPIQVQTALHKLSAKNLQHTVKDINEMYTKKSFAFE